MTPAAYNLMDYFFHCKMEKKAVLYTIYTVVRKKMESSMPITSKALYKQKMLAILTTYCIKHV